MFSSTFFLIALILFFIGASVGSFLNVVIYRTVKNQSWMKGRSRCDHCRKKIHFYDNIPLLSFLLLGGKCRHCKKPIPLSYPVVELMTGLLFVWWYFGGFLFFRLTAQPLQALQPLFWLVVGVLLLLIFFIDLLYLIIPDLAVWLLLALTVIYRLVLVGSGIMQVKDLWLALLGLAIAVSFLGSLYLITKGKGMGLGDVKFAAPMALLVGWPNILIGLFLAFISGASVAVGLLVFKKKSFGQVIPFGPFLVIGTVLSLLWGDVIFQWYLSLL